MDLREIQQKQEEFIQSMQWERFSPSLVYVHLTEELAEIGKHILYQQRYKVKGAGHAGIEGEIAEEFAQSFNLFLQLAIHFGVDLEEAWIKENKRNLKRFDSDVWAGLAEEDEERSTPL